MTGFRERSAYLAARLGLRAGCLATRLLPRQFLYRLSDRLAHIGFYLFRGFRTRSLRNLSVALGEQADGKTTRELVRRSLRNFFRGFVEIGISLTIPSDQLRSEIPVTGRENLDAALTKGHGIIVLSGHLGNFFLLGTRLALEGYPVHVLVNQPSNGQVARLMDDCRFKVQQKTIHARPRRDALRALSRILKSNELAIVIADEHRGTGVLVPFFGRSVLARRGPATLALRTGAAVVPGYLLRERDGRLRLVVEPELELVRDNKNKAAIRENTLRITQWLERTVRAHPDQWNWMNIRWQDSPEADLIGKEQSVQRVSN
jgi:Kdo2-lipid IVA lauroyltransferase/acyltransferase